MKKLLAFLGSLTMVTSSVTGVVACNTKTVNAIYKDANSLTDLWANSPIRTIPINLIWDETKTIETDDTEEIINEKNSAIESALITQVQHLFEMRISNVGEWQAAADSYLYNFSYNGQLILLENFANSFTSLIDKHKMVNETNQVNTFSLTFVVQSKDDSKQVSSSLELVITNQETIIVNDLTEESVDISIAKGIQNYVELDKQVVEIEDTSPAPSPEPPTDGGTEGETDGGTDGETDGETENTTRADLEENEELQNVLWLNEASLTDTITTEKLQSLAYSSLLKKVKNENYIVYINKIWTQIDSKTFELRYRPLTITRFLKYIKSAVKDLETKLNFVEGEVASDGTVIADNSNILARYPEAVNEVNSYWIYGTKFTLRSVKKFQIVAPEIDIDGEGGVTESQT